MSTNKTTKLNLNSWASTDYVKMSEFNDNFTTIDTEVGALKDKVGTSTVAQQITDKVGDTSTLTTTDKSSAVAAINENTFRIGSLSDLVNRGRITVDMLQEPFIIAHRGGANLYPEDTLEAFRNCAATGILAIEAGDVQLLSDGSLGVMHDTTVDRLTNSTGNVTDFDSYSWRNLVVSASKCGLGTGAKDTYPPLLEECIQTFGASIVYVPQSNDEKCAGQIAELFVRYGLKDNVIIQSFYDADLQNAVPYGVKTMMLTGDGSYDPVQAKAKGFDYIGFASTVSPTYVQSCLNAGIKPVVYLVDKRFDWDKWKSYGVVAGFSNDPLYTSGLNTHIRTTDPFARQNYYHGQLITWGNRGTFSSPNKWGWANVPANTNYYALHGWASPMVNPTGSYTITGTMTFEARPTDNGAWGSFIISVDDNYGDTARSTSNGYNICMRISGTIDFYRIVNGSATKIGTVNTPAITVPSSVTLQIQVTPTQIIVTRTGVSAPNSITVNDTTFRGVYLHSGCNGTTGGLTVWFSNISIVNN